jgi:hypothetical protein
MIKKYNNFLNENVNNFTPEELSYFEDLLSKLKDPEWGEGKQFSVNSCLNYNLKDKMEIEPEVEGGYEERETEDLEITKLNEQEYEIRYLSITGDYGFGYEIEDEDIEPEADWDYNYNEISKRIILSGTLAEIKPQFIEFVEKCREINEN